MHDVRDLKGDLHVHSAKEVCETHLGFLINEFDEACGNIPLMEVIETARDKKGMSFIGITNHSSDPIDPNPDRVETAERVHRQMSVLRGFCCEDRGIRIYVGAEVNILPNGELDLDNSVLSELDYAIASMHYLEGVDAKTIQANYLSALKHPNVKVIGHLNRYISLLDSSSWEELVESATHHCCALEFNVAAPMTDELIEMVAKHKSIITLGSDAHLEDATRSFTDHIIGPEMDAKFLYNALERLAPIAESNIVNFWTPDEVSAWLKLG